MAHQVAVGMGVKIADRQPFHMGKHIISQIPEGALGDVDHNTVKGKGRYNADSIKTRYLGDSQRQR